MDEAASFSISGLKETLEIQVDQLAEALSERYIRDLTMSMIFYMFSNMSRQIKEISGENVKEKFISQWKKNIKKQAKKELLSINDKLKSEKMNFLGAISDFSIPSTEDYQKIYDYAINETCDLFNKNLN